jgi:hypothetical protein
MHQREETRAIISELHLATTPALDAYLRGAARDATFNRRHGTMRFAQVANGWLDVIQTALAVLGRKSWRYEEGARGVWVVETCGRIDLNPPRDADEYLLTAWARGYFDADGGIPLNEGARFYIQLCQKNRNDLNRLRQSLVRFGIRCGRLHNPSERVDPHYWRFYVSTDSHVRFAELIGSWHPRKRRLLRARTFVDLTEHAPPVKVTTVWR